MKICTRCKKPGEFSRNKNNADGMSCWCKLCVSNYAQQARVKAANAARMKLRRQTPEGWAVSAWHGIRNRCGNRDGQHPSYANVRLRMTRDEFIGWCVPALTVWRRENPGVRPSVDRIRSAGHYQIGNLRILSLSENSRLSSPHKNVYAAPGQAWCAFCRRYYATENFYKNKRAAHGLQAVCKSCSSAANKKSREARA
jgi:hypothetical protein